MVSIFPQELLDNLQTHRYIPRRIDQDDALDIYHKYFIPELKSIFKLKYRERIDGVEYCFFEDKTSVQVLTRPFNGQVYELIMDTKELLEKDIITDRKKYKGCEIKYWFQYHQRKEYKQFAKFLDISSNHAIIDDKYYHIKADFNTKLKEYENCRILSVR